MKLFKLLFPRYYLRHLAIATAICFAMYMIPGPHYLLAGAWFYFGREEHTWEANGYRNWDWKGLLFPVIPSVLAFLYIGGYLT